MIISHNYNSNKQELSVSYINSNGGKSIMKYKVGRFKAHRIDDAGPLKNWDGRNARLTYTNKPNNFDIKLFLDELPKADKDKIFANNFPRLYTFDIETDYDEGVFPDPEFANYPIVTISIVNDKMDTIVLGMKDLKDSSKIQNDIYDYISGSEFYNKLGLDRPKFTYIKFDDEEAMVRYFLENIVAKAPIMAGWNSLLFDWQYIMNRVDNHLPNINLRCSSMDWTMNTTNKRDLRDNNIRLSMPNHTAIVDMMDVVGTFDMAVMSIKESLSLDYIASESPVGLHKVDYDGSLRELYHSDYDRYVFYNAVDSLLVQLIDKCFKTLHNIYTQSNYTQIPIERAFSKIALSDALFWRYFRDQGMAIVPVERTDERGHLEGAYVKEPTPGKYSWVTCNDFSALYPSMIITCNLSVENFMGPDFTEEELEEFRKDPNYFVSVMGNVYRNDKDYAFKVIQKELKENRAKGKYIAKELNARIVSDIEHKLEGKAYNKDVFSDSIITHLESMGYGYKYIDDIEDPRDFLRIIKENITYLVSYEQACKLLGNSMYGGSSHVSSSFFNILLANDITGEARNLIKMMEKYLVGWFKDHWYSDITESIIGYKPIRIDQDPVKSVYMDTDSCYMSYEGAVKSLSSYNLSEQEILDVIIKINRNYLDQESRKFMSDYYNKRHVHSIHDFELESIARSGIWLNIKKRYAQAIAWQDGRYFDFDNLPIKAKGLEIVKGSYPSKARYILKNLVDRLIKCDDAMDLLRDMNEQYKREWDECDVESICPSSKLNNYEKYVRDAKNMILEPKTPPHVRGAATHNHLILKYGLGTPFVYGGRVRTYTVKDNNKSPRVFTFVPGEYPEWANKYAPIDKKAMYIKCVLDPINRILNAIGADELNYDGFVQGSLFDF